MFNFNKAAIKVGGVCFMLMAFSASGDSEGIEEYINEGLKYYKSGEYIEAVESLNYASQLIQQKRGDGLELFLPAPLTGWTARETSSQAMGAAMFGGGITAERQYNKDSGSITVQIMTDSPILQGMMMMFSNPMYATSEGGKLERIGRQKAIVKFNSNRKEGDIKIVVANRFLVLIEGQGISMEDLQGYAKAIDYKKLETLP